VASTEQSTPWIRSGAGMKGKAQSHQHVQLDVEHVCLIDAETADGMGGPGLARWTVSPAIYTRGHNYID
jgi:hypothetical protein